MAVLKLIAGEPLGQVFELRCERVVLGRQSGCDIVLNQPSISASHAEFVLRNGCYFLRDLQSRNGTLLNGQPVFGSKELLDADEIAICGNVLRFYDGDAPREDTESSTISAVLDADPESNSARLARNPQAKLQAILQLSRQLETVRDLSEVLPRIADSLIAVFPQANAAVVMLVQEDSGSLVEKARQVRGTVDTLLISAAQGWVRAAMKQQKAVLRYELLADYEADGVRNTAQQLYHSQMCAPFASHSRQCLGVARVDMVHHVHRFTDDDLDVLTSVAGQIGLAVENARLLGELKSHRDNFEHMANRFRELFESSADAIFVVDGNGAVQDVNPAAGRLLEMDAARLREATVGDLVPPEKRSETEFGLRQLVEGHRGDFEGAFLTAGGRQVPVEIRARRITLLEQPAILLQARDISDRKQFEKRLADRIGREQQRIGEELHDSVGQKLTGVAMLAESLRRQLSEAGSAESNNAADLVRHIRGIHADLRRISRGLQPVDVHAGGLRNALVELSAQAEVLFRVTCTCEVDDDVPLNDSSISTHLYRIAQEAIHNAVRHGRAKNIGVTLRSTPDRIRLSIENDGEPIPPGFEWADGMGIRLMRYRAGLIGASLEIQSSPQTGVVVEYTLSANSQCLEAP